MMPSSTGARRIAMAALLMLPGALTVYLSFNAGGYFAGSHALVAVVLLVFIVLRTTLANHPFEGYSRPVAVALAAVALHATWALISAAWSDAPARAMLEFDRALLYALVLALFGSLPGSHDRVAWCVRGIALGIAVVSVVALTTRALPEVWPISPNIGNERLSYPLTYWNALGLLASVGLILSLHLTTSTREPLAVRIAGAAISPVLGATLLLTFSRGAIVVAVIGVVAYVVLGRPHALVTGLLAATPATAVAVIVAYNADLLATADPTTAAAVDQGHDLALAVVLCAAGAAVLRGLLSRFDPRLAHARLPLRARPRLTAVVVTVVALGGIVGAVASDLPNLVERQYDRLVASDAGGESVGDTRSRLTNLGSGERVEHWNVALDAFADEPAMGQGAGTYQVLWARERPSVGNVVDGHSLYLETLAELGVIGFATLVLAIAVILARFATQIRGRRRSLYAALFAAGLAWALHAGIDWDWEMPAVTLWFFALGGLAMAARPGERGAAPSPRPLTRLVIAIGCLVLAVTPALVFVSQSRLNDSVAAFERGDCPAAIDAALRSLSAVGTRPEPFEILGYCDSRLGLDSLAIESMRNAVERDPANWEFHYGLAVVRGAAGRDPRPPARMALALNPLEPLTQDLVQRFQTSDPQAWEREAEGTTLPFR